VTITLESVTNGIDRYAVHVTLLNFQFALARGFVRGICLIAREARKHLGSLTLYDNEALYGHRGHLDTIVANERGTMENLD
jgi:hypothetical protein